MHLFHHEVMSSTSSALNFCHKDSLKYSCNILILVFNMWVFFFANNSFMPTLRCMAQIAHFSIVIQLKISLKRNLERNAELY